MKQSFFQIAGLRLQLIVPENLDLDAFALFGVPACTPDVTIAVEQKAVDLTGYTPLYTDMTTTWYTTGAGRLGMMIHPRFKQEPTVFFHTDEAWSNVVVVCEEGINLAHYLCGPVGEIIYRNAIIHRGGMVIHASGIDDKGEGIFFSAPAGTGKTTHSNLWVAYRNASIINGDRPTIILRDGKAFLCGSPWSGSSPVFENKILPLKAMVFLQQAPENRARPIMAAQALSLMAPRCFLPYYSKKEMATAMDTIDAILQAAPAFLLECRPDKDAMEKVLACINNRT